MCRLLQLCKIKSDAVSRSVTLTAAPALQRQQIAASERSNDTGGEAREPGNSPSSAQTSAEMHRGAPRPIRPPVEASPSCVLRLNPSTPRGR